MTVVYALIEGLIITEITFRYITRLANHVSVRRINSALFSCHIARSDKDREIALRAAGVAVIRFSLNMLVGLIVSASFVFLPILIAPSTDVEIYLTLLIFVSFLWGAYRIWQNKRSRLTAYGYSALGKTLHYLALGPREVQRVAFRLEVLFSLKSLRPLKIDSGADRPIYICGLARSGTTLLLELLNNLPNLHSQTYRDMPFVLAPRLWGKLCRINYRDTSREERAHGDNIEIDASSPEAFEEIFWSTHCDVSSPADCYQLSMPDQVLIRKFDVFRRCVLAASQKSTATRYLSKNNNNITRLNFICMESSAKVLFAYRHPVDTALSLHRSHLRFTALQDNNLFILEYMTLLGHHEFGKGHRPFCMARAFQTEGLDPLTPDYWLDYWIAVHAALLDRLESPQICLINHDLLRQSPKKYLSRLLAFLGEDVKFCYSLASKIKPAATKGFSGFDAAMLARAESIYAKFLAHPCNL